MLRPLAFTLALALAGTVGGAGTPVAVASGTAAHRAAPSVTLKATPGTLVQGASTTVKVRTSGATTGQRVQLQRKQSGSWSPVISKRLPSSGKLNLSITPPLGTTSYRVRLSPKGTTPGATSRSVKVTVTLPTQTGALTLPTSAVEGAQVTAAATFTPARPGRAVQLQRSTGGGAFTTVATQTQNSSGAASFGFEADAQGTFQYRAVTVASGGLPAQLSPVRTLVVTEPEPWSGETTLVSHDLNGGAANAYSVYPSISDDGRWVAYLSKASDLVADDPDNDQLDVFLWDRSTDTTVWVNRSSTGGSQDREAGQPIISGDGRYVFYNSPAANVVDAANPNHWTGVIRWDRLTGETIVLGGSYATNGMVVEDVNGTGSQAVVRSSDQTLTADDYSGTPIVNHLFRWTEPTDGQVGSGYLLIDKTSAGKPGNNLVFDAEMSDDGFAIAFTSWATNLDCDVPVTNGQRHAYLWRSTATPKITAVSIDEDSAASGDAYVTGLSDNGAAVGFLYSQTDLGFTTGGFLQAVAWQPSDVATPYRLASHVIGSLTTHGAQTNAEFTLSDAGLSGAIRSFAALDSGDTNGFYDLYAWNDGAITRIALPQAGGQPNQNHGRSQISGDGDTVAFESYATNLTPVTTASSQIFVAGVP